MKHRLLVLDLSAPILYSRLMKLTSMPDTYTFDGDLTTFLGIIGLVFTFAVIVVAYRRYWNSPYRR